MPDYVTPEWKIEEPAKEIMICNQRYVLGGVTYYNMVNHYVLKVFVPPNFDRYFVYDDLHADSLRIGGLCGRPHLYIYFIA